VFSRKRTSRTIVAALAVAAVMTGIAGCSPSSPSAGDEVTLTLMTWDPAQKAGVQAAVDGFEAANPNITVTFEQLPEDQFYTKLDASLGAGEGPDVMWQSSRAPVYIEGGALEPLDEYIERDDVAMDNYPEQLVELYNIDGKQYGMPKDQDVASIVYNTTVFDALGITDVPTADWTWDDMVRIAEEVKSKQTAAADFPLFYNYAFNGTITSIVEQLGGSVVEDGKATVSTPEGIEAFETMKDLQDRGLIPPVADSTDFNAVSSLLSGTIAMAKIPSFQLSLLSKADVPQGTLNVVPVPSINDSRATDTNGLSYVMNANSAQKDAAWELIKYLTSDEGATLHVENGASPAANQSDEVKAAYFEANSALVGLDAAFEATYPDQYLRTTTEFPVTRSVMPELESTVTGPFYAGTLTAEQAAQKADEILNGSFK
jgi:multiple sugar transport system substrate-binding protein